jgi:hypothetical protein
MDWHKFIHLYSERKFEAKKIHNKNIVDFQIKVNY